MERDVQADRGYFGIAVWHPKHQTNIGSLWRSSSLYGAAFLATVGKRYPQRQASDTMHSTMHTPLHHYADVDDLIDHLPHSCPLVGVELDPRAVDLTKFGHPVRALYLFGAEDHGLPPHITDRCHHLVQIPSALPHSMNVACAGAVVMSHRFMNPSRRLVRI